MIKQDSLTHLKARFSLARSLWSSLMAFGFFGLLLFSSLATLLATAPAQAGRMKEIDLLVREALWEHFCGEINERSWKLDWSKAPSDCHFLVEALATDIDLDSDSSAPAQALVCLIRQDSGFFQVLWVESTPLPHCSDE